MRQKSLEARARRARREPDDDYDGDDYDDDDYDDDEEELLAKGALQKRFRWESLILPILSSASSPASSHPRGRTPARYSARHFIQFYDTRETA